MITLLSMTNPRGVRAMLTADDAGAGRLHLRFRVLAPGRAPEERDLDTDEAGEALVLAEAMRVEFTEKGFVEHASRVQ